MAKVRVTLTEAQLEAVVAALYQVGNPLAERFAKLVEAVEASNKAKLEATVEAEPRKGDEKSSAKLRQEAEALKRKREVEEILSIFGNAFR